MKEWIDENTGRKIRQLTEAPDGALLDYFRMPKHVPGGLVIALDKGNSTGIFIVDPESGQCERRELSLRRRLKFRESDGRLWYLGEREGTIWGVNLPSGEPEMLAEMPSELSKARSFDITCDGRTLIMIHTDEGTGSFPGAPSSLDPEELWRYLERSRSGWIGSYDLETGTFATIMRGKDHSFVHPDTSPTDPGLVKYCMDHHDAVCQRAWAARIDGSELRKIRPQELHEFVTHEFWWPDGQYIGYTYQDRRGDSTLRELPWGEYAPVPTQYGVATLKGEECYLSDPLNHYHTHLFISPDGKWAIGEGTDGKDFVYVAPFSFDNTRVDFVPLATIHSPYLPFVGRTVETIITPDSRWMLYNDTIEGNLQVCAVAVDV